MTGNKPDTRRSTPAFASPPLPDPGTITRSVELTSGTSLGEKLASVLRHLLSGGAAFLVDQGLLTAGQSDEVLRLVVAALVIVVSRADFGVLDL